MKVEGGRRKREPSHVFLPPPTQLEPLGLGETFSSDCTDEQDGQKVGSHLEESNSTPRVNSSTDTPLFFGDAPNFYIPCPSFTFPYKVLSPPHSAEGNQVAI